MHHYPFHPGDYMLDTAHLEPLEDLAYRRLLDLYYISEVPIPLETESVSRRLRLGSEVVSKVLNEFFEMREDGWHQARCDAEIVAYKARADRARQNGKGGGRPKIQGKKPSGNPVGSQQEPSRNPVETGLKANQNQEPVTKNQDISPASPPGDAVVKTQPDPRHSEFIKAYSEAYEVETGSKYIFQPREAKTLQTFLARCPATVEQMMTMLRWAWERSKQPFAAKHHSASTIHNFLNDWQQLVMDRSQQRAVKAGTAKTPKHSSCL